MDIKRKALDKLIWAFYLQHMLVMLYLVYEFRVSDQASLLFKWDFWSRYLDLITDITFDLLYYGLAYGVIYLYFYLRREDNSTEA